MLTLPKLRFTVTLLFGVFLLSNHSTAQVYTIASGSWSSGSVWSTGSPPDPASDGVDVIIRHDIQISNSAFNTTVRSLTIENATNNVSSILRFNSGTSVRTLHVLTDLIIEGTTNNTCRIQLEGANTNVTVDGDISVTRNHPGQVTTFGIRLQSGSSMTGTNLIVNYMNSSDDAEEIQVEGTSSLLLSGDVLVTNSGGAEEASIDVSNSARFECNNLTANLTGSESPEAIARDIEIRLNNNAQVTINGDLTLNRTAGRRIAMNIGTTSTANVSVLVKGDMIANHLNGLDSINKNLTVSVRGTSSLTIQVNLTATSNSMRALSFTFSENTLFDIDGDVSLTGSTNSNLTWRVNNTSRQFFGGDILMNYPTIPNSNAFNFSNSTPNISTVTFNGSVNQTIPGGEVYGNLVINNPLQVTPNGNITITNALTLTQGKVLAPGLIVTIKATASLTGSASSYVCNGTMRRELFSGAGPFWFHTGSVEKGYSPMFLTNLSDATTFSVTYSPTSPASASAPGPYNPASAAAPLQVVSNGEYWNITRTVGTGTANLTLGWNSFSDVNGSALDRLRIAHWNGNQWEDMGTCTYSGDASAGQLTTTSPVTSFSPFTLASTTTQNTLLPVLLNSFTLHDEGEKVIARWETSMEINNDFFIVERSIDGHHFEDIGHVDGHGSTNETVVYEYYDVSPLPCRSYYRLQQIDYDGKSEFFNILSIKRKPGNGLYPNPVAYNSSDPVIITLPLCESEEDFRVTIYDLTGKVRWSPDVQATAGQLQFYPGKLALEPGVYSVIMKFASRLIASKLIVH